MNTNLVTYLISDLAVNPCDASDKYLPILFFQEPFLSRTTYLHWSYASNNDIEEPLTPSHLIMGQRVLNPPDVVCYGDGDEDYNMSQSSLNRKMKHFQMILDHFWMR